MTLDELPGALTDSDLIGFEPLDVVVIDDLKPSVLRALLGLPLHIALLPVRIVQGLFRRPKLLIALVVAALVGALAVGYMRQRPAEDLPG